MRYKCLECGSRAVKVYDKKLSSHVGLQLKPITTCLCLVCGQEVRMGDGGSRLSWFIVDNLFPNAPKHLREPQEEELRRLSREDLFLLVTVERLPMDPETEAGIRTQMSNTRALDRLIRRYEIAAAIADAKKNGLYESAGHLNSNVDLNETRDQAEMYSEFMDEGGDPEEWEMW